MRHLTIIALAASLLGGALVSCGAGVGACVGSGGLLSSPECKQDWDAAECDDWNGEGVNDATWTFHGGESCEDLGYTEMCSGDSYRRPGAC